MIDDTSDGINFWPAFSDSMLAVILVLLLVIGAVYLALGEQIKKAQNCEAQFAEGVRATPEKNADGQQRMWTVSVPGTREKLISLKQDPHDSLLLHITFSDAALGFKECDDNLDQTGRQALGDIAAEIQKQAKSIVEIQIQGHADYKPTTACRSYPDNLHLASARADRVFGFLQHSGISPFQVAMSAVSYGEYFPASRKAGDAYTAERWKAANATPDERQANRRVELILRYGTDMKGCQSRK